MERFIGSTCYLVQSVETNHAFFETSSLATVRVCILQNGSGARVLFAALKLPSSGNIADSFWRPGSLACDLDPATGTILKARTKDPLENTEYSEHPQTGNPLVGQTVPHWNALLGLVRVCAPIFAPVRYQSIGRCAHAIGARPHRNQHRRRLRSASMCRSWQAAADFSPTKSAISSDPAVT